MSARRSFSAVAAVIVTGVVALSGAAAQEEPASQKSSPEDPAPSRTAGLNERLLELARSRVAQHEIRVEALKKLGELRRDLARIRVTHAQAHVVQVRAAVEAARAELELRKVELARLRELAAKGVVDAAQVTQAEVAHASASGQIARIQSELQQAEIGIRAAEAELEQGSLEATVRTAEASIELLDAQAEVLRLELSGQRASRFRQPSGSDPAPARSQRLRDGNPGEAASPAPTPRRNTP
jgi:hypothetical protein